MRLSEFRITRFQFGRDRVIGDSQVLIDAVNVAALELVAEDGRTGLGFIQALFHPLPSHDEIVRVFEEEAWPALIGQSPIALVHRVGRPRGGNQRPYSLPYHEAIQVALWDLSGKITGANAKEVFADIVESGKPPAEVVRSKGLEKIADSGAIETAARAAIAANPKAVADFKSGKEAALKSLIGGIMKQTKGQADPKLAEEALRKLLL